MRATELHHADEVDDLAALAAELRAAREAIATLTAERDAMRAKLAEAADDIADWGGYAEPYFREKHKLDEMVAGYRALAGLAAAPE